ncbi:MAG TPA: phospholipase D-like domain-containing protein [Ktedonobacterales bacterium]|nr:phospholipase D-like domain-containing protein [Ktedonobacterales bacterium]
MTNDGLPRTAVHTATAQAAATYTATGLRAYFQSARAGLDAGLPARLAEFIAGAEQTIDCAIYDLRHPAVLQALAQAAASGKRVRIAYDASNERAGGLSGDPKAGGTREAIDASGLSHYATPVHEHGRHLMHDKFVVRDGRAVWCGSANFTVGGLERQDNNCLVLESAELAAAYTATLEDLLRGDHQHAAHAGTGAAPAYALGEARVTPLFAPAVGEGVEDTVTTALKGARRVRVLAFLISDPGILDALAPYAGDPSFDIRGVYDPHGMQDVTRYSRQDAARFWFLHDPRFVAAPSHAFSPAHEQDFMHNKVLVLDDHLVLTGSYNFSENAEANDENILAIDSAPLAAAYMAYFDTLYAAYSLSAQGDAPRATQARHAARLEQEEEMAVADPRPHVLIVHTHGTVFSGTVNFKQSRQQFRGENPVGSTQHFIAYTDGSADGTASAKAVLTAAEADYSALRDSFGGIDLPAGQEGNDVNTPRTALPLQVLIDPQAGGAYHFGCDATDLYIEPHPDEANGLMVAELAEVFEAAINNGWSCGQTNGEALSRALAVDRAPVLASLITETAQGWWANGHADYVNDNSADDTNQDANGCGTLFLYYLHSQLGFSWRQVATTGGATLGDCYAKLAGKSGADGFNDFVGRLAALDQGGQLGLPANGNPFPIGGTAQASPSSSPSDPGNVPLPAVSAPAGAGTGRVIMVVVLVVLVLLAIFGALTATGALHP